MVYGIEIKPEVMTMLSINDGVSDFDHVIWDLDMEEGLEGDLYNKHLEFKGKYEEYISGMYTVGYYLSKKLPNLKVKVCVNQNISVVIVAYLEIEDLKALKVSNLKHMLSLTEDVKVKESLMEDLNKQTNSLESLGFTTSDAKLGTNLIKSSLVQAGLKVLYKEPRLLSL